MDKHKPTSPINMREINFKSPSARTRFRRWAKAFQGALSGANEKFKYAGILTLIFAGLAGASGFSIIGAYYEKAKNHVKWELLAGQSNNEILILVAPFEYIGQASNNKDHFEVQKSIQDKLRQVGLGQNPRVRVEFLPSFITEEDGIAEARRKGKQKNASAVIWGQIAPNRTKFYLTDKIIQQIPSFDANPSFSEFGAVGEKYLSASLSLALPKATNAINFIALWSVGRLLYSEQKFDQSRSLIDDATSLMESTTQGESKLSGLEADGIYGVYSLLEALNNLVANGTPTIFTPALISHIKDRTERRSALLEYELTWRMWAHGKTPAEKKNEMVATMAAMKTRMASEFPALRGMYHLQLSLMYRDKKENHLANQELEKSFEIWKGVPADFPMKYLAMRLAYFHSGDYKSCIEILEEGRKHSSGWTSFEMYDLELGLSECQARLGDASAIESVDRAAKYAIHRLTQARTLHFKASVLEKLGRIDEAAEVLEKTITANPDFTWDKHNLAVYHLKKGNYSRARELELELVKNDSFYNSYKILFLADLRLDLNAGQILQDLNLISVRIPINTGNTDNFTIGVFSINVAATLSVRDGIIFQWPKNWKIDFSVPHIDAQLTEHAREIYSIFGGPGVLAYVDFLKDKGVSSIGLRQAAAYASSGEATKAFNEGRTADGIRWLKRTASYGYIDIKLVNQLKSSELKILKSLLPAPFNIDYSNGNLAYQYNPPLQFRHANRKRTEEAVN